MSVEKGEERLLTHHRGGVENLTRWNPEDFFNGFKRDDGSLYFNK